MSHLNPQVWGPIYWDFLYTLALSYPVKPNESTKKKYYEFYMNLPLFIPVGDIGNHFSKFLDRYPVTSYLDSRESMIKWTHFIHNKVNIYLGKPEMGYYEAMDNYYDKYKLKEVKKKEEHKTKHKYIFTSVLIFLLTIIIFLYFSK